DPRALARGDLGAVVHGAPESGRGPGSDRRIDGAGRSPHGGIARDARRGGGLMARPEGGYRLKDGTRVPGVTTISGKLKNTDALMAWAWREGKEGRDYKMTRDRAADAGSLAHRAVEAWVRGDVYVMEGEPAVVAEGQQGLAGFQI